ncbi:hypothetical protein GOP47_0007715 [Adiantum capillus-veneris]|uniref:DUF1446-domain-containing protein n=1 Tax=Adiantum capillus-veneris TaxID=13818 RepID=A0A9D4ZLS9_ADICA|nr:hypothetical protein GOP47_0007715 [Adiantum capillus-veneris]
MAFFDCTVELRNKPKQHKKLVRIGCGAGFAGDRPLAALKLLMKVQEMHYLVLECLAERTLAIRHDALMAGGKGYDPRISEWMQLLLPEAVKRNVCIITNMGAVDAEGAQVEVLKVAKQCQLHISVGIIREVFTDSVGSKPGSSTYLGASTIVKLLEESKPNVILTTRLADASLFLGPMVYELGWNWDNFEKLAQGTLAGHLLECGCQVTGGYFAHPADEYRNLSAQQLVDISLPYAEISEHGDVIIAKPKHTGGELSAVTCGQQLLYEVGDPSFYITPDVVVDFTNVTFESLNAHQVRAKGAKPGPSMRPEKLLRLVPQDCGWKAWGEISYGGAGCIQRAAAAELMVRAWMEEVFPKSSERTVGYLIGVNSLLISPIELPETKEALDVRLRMDGLFDLKEQAVGFTREFEALYTNGPAGGGGISVGCRKETALNKILVHREETFWKMNTRAVDVINAEMPFVRGSLSIKPPEGVQIPIPLNTRMSTGSKAPLPAPGGVELPLYKVAHCRAGDKGNDVNFSLIPHCPTDLLRLQSIITKDWVKRVTGRLFLGHHIGNDTSSSQTRGLVHDEHDNARSIEIYVATGIHAMNIVVRNALDGGVTCSRRLDRHGKSLSDLILCQRVTLPVEEIKTC